MRLLWDLKRQAWLLIELKGVGALHTSHQAPFTAKAQITFRRKDVSYQGRSLTISESFTGTVAKFLGQSTRVLIHSQESMPTCVQDTT